MTRRAPLSYDGAVLKYNEYDEDGIKRRVQVQDVEPIAEFNKALSGADVKGLRWENLFGDEGRLKARIPKVIWRQWVLETGGKLPQMDPQEMREFIDRKLAMPEFRWLKIAPIAKTTVIMPPDLKRKQSA